MTTRLLLDSHVLLWALVDDPKLGPKARDQMQLADDVYVSAATVWELVIKQQRGRIELPQSLSTVIPQLGFEFLDITTAHVEAISSIELPHNDPFDRLLMSQALIENLTFLTVDSVILATAMPYLVNAKD